MWTQELEFISGHSFMYVRMYVCTRSLRRRIECLNVVPHVFLPIVSCHTDWYHRGGWNSITCLCVANSQEHFSMEPSILNRGTNIYSDVKYCIYSLRSSHSWTIIYQTHTSPFTSLLQNIQYAENMYSELISFSYGY